MQTELITSERFTTSVWSGGETTELFILPADASYAKRTFRARISSATVALDRSVFTSLPGVTRYLSPLDGALLLRVADHDPVLLCRGDILRFDGGAPVECEGRGRDLNLMLLNCAGIMLYASTIRVTDRQCALVFAHQPLALRVGQSAFRLPENSLLRVCPDADETVDVGADEPFYAFILDHFLGEQIDER